MEGMRQRVFPRAMFSGFNAPDLRASVSRTHFATGGMVPGPESQKADAAKKGIEDRLTINNIVDPAIMGNYLASAPGERQFINIIAANAFQIRQAIFGT